MFVLHVCVAVPLDHIDHCKRPVDKSVASTQEKILLFLNKKPVPPVLAGSSGGYYC